jgi:cell wall-associated NlpC family hydrolase
MALALFALPGGAAAVTTSEAGGVQLIIDSSATPAPATVHSPTAQPLPALGPPSSLAGAGALIRIAYALNGTRYLWGGASPAGFDCSGFIWYVFRQIGIAIPRTADNQFARGRRPAGDPLPGDLVFFQTYDYGASHVGLYLGGGRFLSAIGANVHLDSFSTAYFRGRYLGARRFLPG